MSLEESINALVKAITENTAAMVERTGLARSLYVEKEVAEPGLTREQVAEGLSEARIAASTNNLGAVERGVANRIAAAEVAEAKKPGRPRKTPPSPIDAAASSTPATNTPGSAPAVASTSAKGTYADLQQLVPQLAEEKGRNAAIKVFADLGFANGRELQEKAPERIGEAVEAFRAALAS